MNRDELGAYGFHLICPSGEDEELPDLSPLDGDATAVALTWRHATALIEKTRIDDDCVWLAERGTSSLEVRRDPASITVEFTEPATPETLVHPLLTPPFSILARWRGDLTLHAGAFLANDKAWAVFGAREAGKSTTLSKLAQRGQPLLADDLLVLDDGVARAGPACIDLRPDVAQRFPDARFLGKVGARPRYRLNTPRGPARAPLAGFFLLEWSDSEAIEVEQMPTVEALQTIYRQEYIGLLGPGDPQKIMDLLGAPMWRVRRPPNWDLTPRAVDQILELTGS